MDDAALEIEDQLYNQFNSTLKVEKGIGTIKIKLDALESFINTPIGGDSEVEEIDLSKYADLGETETEDEIQELDLDEIKNEINLALRGVSNNLTNSITFSRPQLRPSVQVTKRTLNKIVIFSLNLSQSVLNLR